MGGLVITFLLTEGSALHRPVLYLSHYFKRHRQAYYDHLRRGPGKGDWESWLAFFLRCVIEVGTEAAATAPRILVLREEHRATITRDLGWAAANSHKVLESLYDRPIVSAVDVKKMTGATYLCRGQHLGVAPGPARRPGRDDRLRAQPAGFLFDGSRSARINP